MPSNVMPSGIIVYQVVCDGNLSERARSPSLGPHYFSDDRDCITFAAKLTFGRVIIFYC